MEKDLRVKILRYSLYVISFMIFGGGTVYVANGLPFGYILYFFLGVMLALIIWNHQKPEKTHVQAPLFSIAFNILIYIGGIMLNGLDGSAPVVFIVWTVLSIAILNSKWSVLIVIISVIEQISFRVLHETTSNFLVPYNDYTTELNDKTFIFIAGCTASGLLIRSYLIKNISEQKKLLKSQEELEQANAELKAKQLELSESAWKLKESNERLEEFAYITSHDLKTPIRGAKNLIDFTIEDFENDLPEEALSNLNKAKGSLLKMNSLVMDLLAFSKADKIEFSYKETNLNDLVKGISEDFEQNENIKITIGPLPNVIVDSSRIREVIYNLITNGLKYNQSPIKAIEIGFTQETTSMWIKDNGIGIDKTNHEKIFKFFQRLHNDSEYEGTGTGLALVKRILERHQIDITIQSSLGNGAIFYLDLTNCINTKKSQS